MERRALKFINDLPRIIYESVVYKNTDNRIILKTPKETLITSRSGSEQPKADDILLQNQHSDSTPKNFNESRGTKHKGQ